MKNYKYKLILKRDIWDENEIATTVIVENFNLIDDFLKEYSFILVGKELIHSKNN